MANPHVIQRDEECARCKRMCRRGEEKYGHAEGNGPQRWYCVSCAEVLKLICLNSTCNTKKNPKWHFCFQCMRNVKEQVERKNEQEENEYEKELKEEEEREKKKIEEEEIEKKREEEEKEKENTKEVIVTCLSLNCPERESICCNSYSAETESGMFLCRKCLKEFKGKPCNARSKMPLNVAFDIDDTLWKIREDKKGQCPDYDLINVLKWFVNNGDNVYVWSAGGVDYAKQIVWKLGLDHLVTVIPKGKLNERHPDNPPMDLSFDDCEVNLARVDVNVKRPDYKSELKKAED